MGVKIREMKDPARSNFRSRRSETVEYWRHFRVILRDDSNRDSCGGQRQGGEGKKERKRERESFRARSWKVLSPFYWLTSCFALSTSTGDLPRWIFRETAAKGHVRERARTVLVSAGRLLLGYLYLPPSASLHKPLTPCISTRRNRVALVTFS